MPPHQASEWWVERLHLSCLHDGCGQAKCEESQMFMITLDSRGFRTEREAEEERAKMKAAKVNPKYGLTIYCEDGDTIYGAVSRDRKVLLTFLERYDNEGTSLELKMERPDGSTKDNYDAKLIYEELRKP